MTESKSDDTPSVAPHQFDADIPQVMSILINSIYPEKEIFMRELVSNACDAMSKRRFEGLTNPSTLPSNTLQIEIIPDEEKQTLTIRDNGIGMDRQEMIDNLGTIANSDTRKFQEMATTDKKGAIDLIGKFGVGFYSVFLVADTVAVHSRGVKSDEVLCWTSNSDHYTIVPSDIDLPEGGGTHIVLHLKDEQKEYTKESRLMEVLKTHSEFVGFPIQLRVIRDVTKPVEEDEEGGDDDDDERPQIEEVDDDEKKEPKTRTIQTEQWLHVNSQPPIWTVDPKVCTPEQYGSFFSCLNKIKSKYMELEHFKAEGSFNFNGLLFCPEKAPYQMERDVRKIKLYVRKVFITDDCKNLIPDYLNFVHGVVDSHDLPLNISRTILQQSQAIRVMRKTIVKKCLTMFERIAADEDRYKIFFEQFGKNVKFGVHEDHANRDRLVDLLRFQSTNSDTTLTSIKDYVGRMQPSQTVIYYLTGENRQLLDNSPMMEGLRKRNLEVLFLVDPIDEYIVPLIPSYKSKAEEGGTSTDLKLKCASKANLSFELTDEEIATQKRDSAYYKAMCEHLKTIIFPNVSNVIISNRIEDSPCCLVTSEYGWTANFERIIKSQPLRDENVFQHAPVDKILELNANHGIIEHLHHLYTTDQTAFTDLGLLLYDSALLSCGFQHPTPIEFSRRIYKNLTLREKPTTDKMNELIAEMETKQNATGESEVDDIPEHDDVTEKGDDIPDDLPELEAIPEHDDAEFEDGDDLPELEAIPEHDDVTEKGDDIPELDEHDDMTESDDESEVEIIEAELD